MGHTKAEVKQAPSLHLEALGPSRLLINFTYLDVIIGDTCGFCAQDILPQCIVLKRLLSCMSSNLEMIIGYASLRSSAATAEKSYYINLVDE